MFKYKTEAELEKMTPDQRDIYSEQKRAFEAESTQKMIADAIAKAFPAKTAEEIKAETDAIEAQKAAFDALKEDVQQIKEQTNGGGKITVKLVDEIREKKDSLRKMIKGDAGEVTMKADTARASVTTNPNQLLIPGIGQLIRVARAFYDVCRKINLPVGSHNGTIKYIDWDEATTVKAAAMVAEGGTFPESTAKFKGYSIDLKKVGDSLPVNEEFFEDEANCAAELDMFLDNNVESKIDDAIINGDGTGDNLTGLLASVAQWTLPATGDVVDANIYDLIVKVKGTITSAGGNKYKPNVAVMNNDTINRLLLKKDANNNYMFPPNHPIFAMTVEDNSIADNVLVVGDSRFAAIYEMGGVTLSKGMIANQFVEDQLTLKARKRLLFLIKNSDQSGFRKVADIDAALTAITAV